MVRVEGRLWGGRFCAATAVGVTHKGLGVGLRGLLLVRQVGEAVLGTVGMYRCWAVGAVSPGSQAGVAGSVLWWRCAALGLEAVPAICSAR